MERKLIFGISLIVIALTVMSAVSASVIDPNIVHPYTRFSHEDDWCMYYTGDAMCWVPHQYCNFDGTQRQYRWGDFGPCPEPLKNDPPQLNMRSKAMTVEETELVVIGAECIDPQGQETTITYSGWMNSDSKITDYNDAGEYKVKVKCEDSSGLISEAKVRITVLNKNRAPYFVDWS